MQAIILDAEDSYHVDLLGCGWEYYDECANFDEWRDIIWYKTKVLEKKTKKFLYGQDNAKDFFASDDEDSLKAIQEIFPGFSLEEIDPEDYPWDYDYRIQK